MFKKKKQPEMIINYDYTKWTEDLGFLNLLLSRKKGITKEFLIGTYSKQKEATDYLTDEEIEPIVSRCVKEILSQISGNYKTFLINKYFGTEENLITFITEDCYVDLVSESVKRNTNKIIQNVQRKAVEAVIQK